MKSNTMRASALLLSLFLSGLTSSAYAAWYSCDITEDTVLGGGDYVCCQGTVSSTDSSSLQLTLGRHKGVKVTCMAEHSKAWGWNGLGKTEECGEKFSNNIYYDHPYRCQAK
ncbi:MAG: hypothetical protein JSS53_09560 [Proteobacteria bacterium]|nr:hypothetical protein [Pseudomonadota bacterium]